MAARRFAQRAPETYESLRYGTANDERTLGGIARERSGHRARRKDIGLSARYRRLRRALAAVGALAASLPLVVGAPHAHADGPTVTVTPNTDLVDQAVTISYSGFDPAAGAI